MNQNSGKCILTHKVRDIAKLAVCPKLDSQESSLTVSAHKTNEASTREGAGFCYSVGSVAGCSCLSFASDLLPLCLPFTSTLLAICLVLPDTPLDRQADSEGLHRALQ